MLEKITRTELSALASTLGAGILGFGLGVFLENYFQQYVFWIILIGILMHGWGMYEVHQKNKESDHKNSISQIKRCEFSWTNLLYWLCWVIIFGLIYVLVKILWK